MSSQTEELPIHKRPLVYRLADCDDVTVRRDLEYGQTDSGPLTFDLYEPPGASDIPRPAVVFVSGYPDPGMEAVVGCKLKEMTFYIGWGELVAACGMVGVTYTNADPVGDARALLEYLADNAAALGLDGRRLGLWACSGNVPNALGLLMSARAESVRCAALSYGFLLDLDESTAVADSASSFGFANPAAGKAIEDLPRDLPLFITRAGRDEFVGLNETLDRFVAAALARNQPLTLVNCADSPHAFDMMDDGETSREAIRSVLRFLQLHLLEATDASDDSKPASRG